MRWIAAASFHRSRVQQLRNGKAKGCRLSLPADTNPQCYYIGWLVDTLAGHVAEAEADSSQPCMYPGARNRDRIRHPSKSKSKRTGRRAAHISIIIISSSYSLIGHAVLDCLPLRQSLLCPLALLALPSHSSSSTTSLRCWSNR